MQFVRHTPEELRAKVLKIELRARKILNQDLKGAYRSHFHGHGMEFDQVREYQDGDEQRMVDWNVTARMGHPFVKKFMEERENSVLLALDVSGSQNFGSVQYAKSEMAAEFAAVVSIIAQQNNDRVGLFLFAGDYEYFVPPRKGKSHWQQTLFDILGGAGKGKGTHLALSFAKMAKLLKKKSLIFLLSDYLDSRDFENELSVLNQRHHLVCVLLQDDAEKRMPRIGLVRMMDLETGRTVWVDTDDAAWRKEYEKLNRQRMQRILELCRKRRIDWVQVEPGIDYRRELLKIFNNRQRVF